MKFIRGTPLFAVEVRSECDYGKAAELAMAAKRADYFEAGTLVVWDVDPLARTVTKHTFTGCTSFSNDQIVDAEPAVPGWSMTLTDVFAES
jgi:Uma2 family endonuclease